jgi:iron(III) transport system permease protein
VEGVEAVRPLDLVGPRPVRPARRRAPRGVVLGGLLVAAAALLPAVYLVVRSSDAGTSGIWTILAESRTHGLLARTALLAVAVTAASVAIGVPLAWLTVRTDLPGRRAWSVLGALPLVVPSYVAGYVFVTALGPRGIVQRWLAPLGVERLPSIYGFVGAWLVLTLFTYPYVLLTVRAAIRGLDPALEEASLGLGVGRRETFRRVILPQLRPAIAAGGLLVALYTVHDFGAVSLMRFDSFTRAIYVSYHGSFDRTRAAVLALVLVTLILLVLVAEARLRGRGAYYRLHGSARPASVSPLGRWRWPAFAGCALLAGLTLVLPLGVIVYWLARSVRAAEPLHDTFVAGLHSLQASAPAAVAAVAAAWPIAYLSVRHPGRRARLLERSCYVGYALPGIVVALSLVFFGVRLAPALYQTLVMLVFAYVVLFLPQSIGAQRASLLQVHPHLEEAAQSLGSRRPRTLARVVLPLVRPGLLAGAALVFLTAMKELPATLLLAPTGFRTLATEVWNATSAALFDRAAPAALGLVLLASAPLAVIVLREERGGAR